MSKKNPLKNDFAASAEIATRRYRGPDRREGQDKAPDDVAVEIRFDAKGNPVWEMRTTAPRRREDDDTFDLLKCLQVDSLSIASNETDGSPDRERSARRPGAGYDPYDRAKKK
jgi:hypothetical protein